MCLRIPNQPKEVAVYIYTNAHAHSAYHMHIVEYITIQCIRKVFTALQHFSTCYVTVVFQNWLNNFFIKILHTIPDNDKVKQVFVVVHFCKSKKKNEKITIH